MARTKRSNDILSNTFVSAVKTACRELLSDSTDLDTCVSAKKVAAHKAVKNHFTVTNATELEGLVRACVPQMHGFSSRRGQNGGIHRVKVSRNRTVKPAQAEVQAVSDNDNGESTQEVVNG